MQRDAASKGEGAMTQRVEQPRLQKDVVEARWLEEGRGATRPGVSSSRMLRVSSGQPKLQRSVGREVEGTKPRMSGAREAGKSRLKGARSTT